MTCVPLLADTRLIVCFSGLRFNAASSQVAMYKCSVASNQETFMHVYMAYSIQWIVEFCTTSDEQVYKLSFSAGGLGNFPNHLLPNPTISAFQVNPSTLTQDLNPTAPPGTFVQPDPPVSSSTK